MLSDKASDDIVHKAFDENFLVNTRKPRNITAKSLMDAADFIMNENNLKDLKIPLFVVHSKQDKITNPNASKMFVDKVSSKEKEHKMYDNGWHLMFHDCDKDIVYNDIEKWMINRIELMETQKDDETFTNTSNVMEESSSYQINYGTFDM